MQNSVEDISFNSNSLSGNYDLFPLKRLPEEVFKKIINSEDSFLHEPMMLQNGSILLLYVYEVIKEKKATLENSYSFIESIALDKKTIDHLNLWLDKNKQGLYINTFE